MPNSLDTSAFLSGVKRVLDDIRGDAARELEDTGEDAVRIAQGLARRDTGEMAASIHTTVGEDANGPYTEITVESDHAVFNEFGTSQMPAQPFIRPGTAAAAAQHLKREP
jgi:HK97 gp10 family phage protein